jgi:hypothetical protein
MLIFILNPEDYPEPVLRETIRSISASLPEGRIVVAANPAADVMNRELEAAGEPFFLTFTAGETVRPSIAAEWRQWLQLLPEHAAGLYCETVFQNRHGRRPGQKPQRSADPLHPTLWRSSAVRGGAHPLFAAGDRMPFPGYVLQAKALELAHEWSWERVTSEAILRRAPRPPLWRRSNEEWSRIRPLLAAPERRAGAWTQGGGPAPEVSVVVCAYNAENDILWALSSVRRQSHSGWELIVVDDGSTDGTPQKILSAAAEDPRILPILCQTNRGKAFSLNLALSRARGRWLLELDADDWLDPACVWTMLEAAEQATPGTACLYGRYCEWSEISGRRLVFRGERRVMEKFDGKKLLDEAYPLAPRLYRTSILKRLEGWNTRGPYGGRLYEDFEMLLRLAEQHAIASVGVPLYHRRIRPSSVTHRHREEYALWKQWITGRNR